MFDERRRYIRFSGELDGAFHILESEVDGMLMINNFSREGIGISLNREVEFGKVIECEMKFPRSIMPFFITGRIMWVNNQGKRFSYKYDAGIKLERIDSLDRNRIMEYFYQNWYKAKDSIVR